MRTAKNDPKNKLGRNLQALRAYRKWSLTEDLSCFFYEKDPTVNLKCQKVCENVLKC